MPLRFRFHVESGAGRGHRPGGALGAGKSTVFQLLLRFFAAEQGTILFDVVDIAELDPIALRRHIAVVAQVTVIFSGSVASNIALWRPKMRRPADVRRAADAAAASEFIEMLPDGFDTLVGERGITLSGGQRQRSPLPAPSCAMPRSCCWTKPPARWTRKTNSWCRRGLANLMVGRTTIVMAHRLATIQKLARIVSG